VIVVACLNPAFDITHYVPAVDWAGVYKETDAGPRAPAVGASAGRRHW
jgi:hypothetical protein